MGYSTFQSSSSLLICWAVICRARSCSCSDGILTSQERKHRSWIRGCHCELSQLMSFKLLWLAHGCLCHDQNHMWNVIVKCCICFEIVMEFRVQGVLTCKAAPQLSRLWQGWSPAERHCGNHSYSTPKLFPPAVRPYVGSPPWTLLSPGGLQCGYKGRES